MISICSFSKTLFFLRYADVFRQSSMVFTEQTGLVNLYSMINYCVNNTICKRKIIAQHFNDTFNELCNEMCDYCKNLADDKISNYNFNFINEVKCIVECMEKHALTAVAKSKEKRLTANKLSELAFNDINKKLTLNRKLENDSKYVITSTDIEKLILNMIMREFLKEDFHFTPYNTICYIIKGYRSEELDNVKEFYMIINGNSNQKSEKSCAKRSLEAPVVDDVIVLDDDDIDFKVKGKTKRKKITEKEDD